MKRIYVNRRNYWKFYLVLLAFIFGAFFIKDIAKLQVIFYGLLGGILGISFLMILYHIGNLIYFKSLLERDERFKIKDDTFV